MNPISSFRHRYRLYQAYSQYPLISISCDLAKTGCLIGLISASSWFGFSVVTQQKHLQTRPNSLSVASHTKQADNLDNATDITFSTVDRSKQQMLEGDVEIPAVATSESGRLTTAIIKNIKPIAMEFKSDHKHIYDENWVFILPADKFVIQFGSSLDRERLYADATAFPTGPVAIYPFKKTPSDRIVYGYSSGIYNNLDDAQRALQTFPKTVLANRPWIRPVDALKKQIMEVTKAQ